VPFLGICRGREAKGTDGSGGVGRNLGTKARIRGLLPRIRGVSLLGEEGLDTPPAHQGHTDFWGGDESRGVAGKAKKPSVWLGRGSRCSTDRPGVRKK